MAVDFQCVFPQTVVPLSSVSNVPGLSPRTLQVIGQDFSSVDQVLLNDIASPSVVILSKTKLLAQVPGPLTFTVITSVTVTSNNLTVSPRSLIKFQISSPASKVSGILRLLQIFLKILFTTPGRDIFAPRVGGNGLKDVGLTFGSDEGGNIVSDFTIAVATTVRQILAIQSKNPTLASSERLMSATVTSATYSSTESALIVSIKVVSQAGQSATANVMV
jgi:hypothetical protein